MSKKAKVEVADVAAVTETAAAPQAVTVEAPGDPLPADDGADIVDGVDVEAWQSLAQYQAAQPKVGDPTRWRNLDGRVKGYEIKDRGVLIDNAFGIAFVPATKLVPDVNNGWRIVAG
jgi:hypothetical protein